MYMQTIQTMVRESYILYMIMYNSQMVISACSILPRDDLRKDVQLTTIRQCSLQVGNMKGVPDV